MCVLFPNIAGVHSLLYTSDAGWSGAFFNVNGGTQCSSINGGSGIWNVTLGFHASNSNSTYGLSSTNQPASLRSLALIRAY